MSRQRASAEPWFDSEQFDALQAVLGPALQQELPVAFENLAALAATLRGTTPRSLLTEYAIGLAYVVRQVERGHSVAPRFDPVALRAAFEAAATCQLVDYCFAAWRSLPVREPQAAVPPTEPPSRQTEQASDATATIDDETDPPKVH